jgi:hypothetical protein
MLVGVAILTLSLQGRSVRAFMICRRKIVQCC